mgnify:CR=1 FL=1
MELPDLSAFTLGQAKAVLAEKGFSKLEIHITAPPKENVTEYDDNFRIVRTQLKTDGTVSLLICRPL